MDSTVTDKDRDPLFFLLFTWILVGFTSLFALMGVGTGQMISFAVWITAIAIVLPPLKRWLIVKLPFLKNRFLKVFC
jgi:hypothetical protein